MQLSNSPVLSASFGRSSLMLLALSVALIFPGLLWADPQAPAQNPSAAHPLDPAIRLVAEAKQSFQGVRDYTCLFIKRERIRGQLQIENLITMRSRTQPFSVYLKWLGPRPFTNQEVCYVESRNNGMMRVKAAGLIGAVGFVSLDPRDPRAMENSRHTINEAGIGNLIERFTAGYDQDRRINRTQVRIADYDYNKRRCTRVETIHLDNSAGPGGFYRSIVYFDKENKLPIRVENYDWPRQGGAPGGELLEEYSYVDLKLNVGLTDQHFNY